MTEDTKRKSVEENWINIDDVAKYFGVKPATIRDWIRKGKGIPAKKNWKIVEIQIF